MSGNDNGPTLSSYALAQFDQKSHKARLCCMALCPVQPEPARGRGDDAGKLSRRFVRDDPVLDHKGLNNCAENNHFPFRKRERVMQGFRSPGSLQRFVSMQSATRNSFSVPARRRSALTIRYHRLEAFEAWKSAANVA